MTEMQRHSRGPRLRTATTSPVDRPAGQRGWHDQAACKGMPLERFFPDSDRDVRAKAKEIAAAKAVCDTCPVKLQCRDEFLEERFGVFGGTTPSQRDAIRKHQAREAA